MQRQYKSKWWTFFFSIIPGVGHMYLGLPRRGTSFLLLSTLLIFLSSELSFGLLMLFFPLVWFLSLFDAQNLASHSVDELSVMPDKMVLFDGVFSQNSSFTQGRGGLWLGVGLVVLGGWLLLRYSLNGVLGTLLHDGVYDQLVGFGRAVLPAGLLIALGVLLLRGRRAQEIPVDRPQASPADETNGGPIPTFDGAAQQARQEPAPDGGPAPEQTADAEGEEKPQ